MFRESLGNDSRHWSLLIDQRQSELGQTQRICRFRRLQTGAGTWKGEGNDAIPCTNEEPIFQDVTLEIVKTDNSVTGTLYYSNGQSRTIGTDTVSLGSSFYVGIFVAGAQEDLLRAGDWIINDNYVSFF